MTVCCPRLGGMRAGVVRVMGASARAVAETGTALGASAVATRLRALARVAGPMSMTPFGRVTFTVRRAMPVAGACP